MTENMKNKVENLRKALNGEKVTYEKLARMVANNKDFPSMSSLHKYKMLVLVEEEVCEDTMEEWEYDYQRGEGLDDMVWDEARGLYVGYFTVKWYRV